MRNLKTVEAVRERERELYFNKINKMKNEGTFFAFFYNELKDGNMAI